jgi:hypothetical protein
LASLPNNDVRGAVLGHVTYAPRAYAAWQTGSTDGNITFELLLTLGVLVAVFAHPHDGFPERRRRDAGRTYGHDARALSTWTVRFGALQTRRFWLSVAESQGLAPRAMMVSITLAASMAFITPIGY